MGLAIKLILYEYSSDGGPECVVVVARIMDVLVFSERFHKDSSNFTESTIWWWLQLPSNGQWWTSGF